MLNPKTFCCLLVSLLAAKSGLAQQDALDSCLLEQIKNPDNNALTVSTVRNLCENTVTTPSTELSIPLAATPVQAQFSEFFEPYKQSYLIFGSLQNKQGGEPFSGKTLDIRFELGMKFRLLPEREVYTGLEPLYFGYSQKSWWDIAEASAPFREHNYNPEVFWDFRKASSHNGFNFLGNFIDLLGFEHQSNGRGGAESRSWERLYAQRELALSDQFSLKLKAWNIVNQGKNNADIADYLGNASLQMTYRPNKRLDVNLSTIKGLDTGKISYQLDFIYNIPEWVNSHFLISYYEGYGEALISYNEKTKSLRAGLYFPIDFDSF